MTRSELCQRLAARFENLDEDVTETAVKCLLEQISHALASGKRIKIRGFGSFSLHHHTPRVGRNPKTGAPVELPSRFTAHFKPGKALRERVNASSRPK